MITCRISFALICIVAIVGGGCILALQIVAASTKAWVTISSQQSTFYFGIFSHEAKVFSATVTMVRNTALICLQAMLVFSVGSGSTAIITTLIGLTQRQICGRGTHFYIKITEICFVLSAILWLIGMSVFTHFWIKESNTFFTPSLAGAGYNYGYAYMLGWLVFFLQVAISVGIIIGINVVVRKRDNELSGTDDSASDERKKLVGPSTTKHSKNQTQPQSSKADIQAGESTSTTGNDKKNTDKIVATTRKDDTEAKQG